MDFGLQGRVAMVAASSQGLGKAVALGLAREGAKLALCARTERTLTEAAEEIYRATGADVLTRALDVTNFEQVPHSCVKPSTSSADSISAWPMPAVRHPNPSPTPPSKNGTVPAS